MAKASRGGKRTSSPTLIASQQTVQQPVQVTPPTPAQVAQGNVLPAGGVPFDQFEQMTDDQKADVITNALGVATPIFLDDSGLQKLAYFTGLNTKPQVVDEATINSMQGQDLWRSVKSVYNRSTDISYSGKDIYKQIATGAYTQYSDSGGSVHGKGIYFDVNKGSYGSGQGYTIIHAKVASGAKTITESRLDKMWAREQQSGSKLARAIGRADYHSQKSLYAMAKGYDIIEDTGSGWHSNYRMVLNRRGLVVSTKTN